MSLKIRSLVDTDVPQVAGIADQFAHNSWTEAVFKDCLKADYQTWVLENTLTDKILGFLVVCSHEHECQIMNIGVAPSIQRKGYACRLLSHLFDELRQSSVSQITLEVRASNRAAIQLYEKMNFTKIGIRKSYYPLQSGREDALIYTSALR